MRLHPLNLNIILIFCGSLDPTRTLQIFRGTLTEITCSATVPAFRLVKQGMQYDPEQYIELSDLFDIEARLSPNRNNVTLIINGTSRSDNVTIMCRNITDAFSGQFQILFTLMLEFISILPAPNNASYIRLNQDPTRQLQIIWEPPNLFSQDDFGSQNVSIYSRITHYIISITTEESMINYTTSRTSVNIELDDTAISCRFSFQVAAVNQAGMGEYSPPQIVDWCANFTAFSTDIEPDQASRAKILSAGEIAAIVICTCVAAVITTALVVGLVLIFVKLKNYEHTQNLKSGSSDDLSIPLPVNKKHMEPGHCNGDSDDQKQQVGSNYSQSGPPVYADITTTRKNQIPEPSSADCISYAKLEHPNQVIENDS